MPFHLTLGDLIRKLTKNLTMKKVYMLLTAMLLTSATAFSADGDSCQAPIAVDFSIDLPYADSNQTTCGRGNNYDATCLAGYDGGEDIIYEFTLSANMEVTITFDPNGTTWTGIALFDVCPDVATDCLDFVTGSSGSE